MVYYKTNLHQVVMLLKNSGIYKTVLTHLILAAQYNSYFFAAYLENSKNEVLNFLTKAVQKREIKNPIS